MAMRDLVAIVTTVVVSLKQNLTRSALCRCCVNMLNLYNFPENIHFHKNYIRVL